MGAPLVGSGNRHSTGAIAARVGEWPCLGTRVVWLSLGNAECVHADWDHDRTSELDGRTGPAPLDLALYERMRGGMVGNEGWVQGLKGVGRLNLARHATIAAGGVGLTDVLAP